MCKITFIQLSLTLTKLCHYYVMRDVLHHRARFCESSEFLHFNKNAKNAISLQKFDRSPQNLRRPNNAERVPGVTNC